MRRGFPVASGVVDRHLLLPDVVAAHPGFTHRWADLTNGPDRIPFLDTTSQEYAMEPHLLIILLALLLS
ncbi:MULTISPECIES: hypothetical protein [Saccharothrix]|uniref:hypothetical protein n=1 Tax=Saccharothrix TaxID=2071 RepID=UPI00093A5AC2|nr:hypothetical protein [Saccharothrix sp. CB00851]OKI26362.1 hypothetical protein A6A25_32265 [Saccharothrix sp. CB00851]